MFSPTTSEARARGLVGEVRKQLTEQLGLSEELLLTRPNIGYGLGLAAAEVIISN